MTTRLWADELTDKSLIQQLEELYREVVNEVFAAIRVIRSGELDKKETTQAVKDLRTFLQLVLEERAKVAKLEKHDAGVVYDYALDFDAARTEIGRRLACLRDAGGG